VDRTVRNPGGAAENARQVVLSQVASPAVFVEAAGWQCLYGINLGRSSTGRNSPSPRGPRGRLLLSAAWFLPALAPRSATSPTSLATPETTTPATRYFPQLPALWGQYCHAILAITPYAATPFPIQLPQSAIIAT
jgi:hypothetical protein